MDNISIKIEGLSKNFGEHWALKNISLDIKEGEIFGLLAFADEDFVIPEYVSHHFTR